MSKTYAKIILSAAFALLVVPVFSSADFQNQNSINGGNFITGGPIGNPCLVPIFHTDFAFPPEGGQIIKIGDQLYFDRTYLPDCGGGLPPGSVPAGYTAQPVTTVPGQTTLPVQQNPVYVAPKTGCN